MFRSLCLIHNVVKDAAYQAMAIYSLQTSMNVYVQEQGTGGKLYHGSFRSHVNSSLEGQITSQTLKATFAGGLFFNFIRNCWLPTVDNLRNLF